MDSIICSPFCEFFFPNKWQKMNTVSQTESKTLLQHHSFKNSNTLCPA